MGPLFRTVNHDEESLFWVPPGELTARVFWTHPRYSGEGRVPAWPLFAQSLTMKNLCFVGRIPPRFFGSHPLGSVGGGRLRGPFYVQSTTMEVVPGGVNPQVFLLDPSAIGE